MLPIDPLRLPFDKAIAYFRKKLPLPSEKWDDFADAAQDVAFTVAGVTSADLLNDVYNLVGKALENGDSFDQFKQGFNEAVDRAGWNPEKRGWRTEMIYGQNLRNAYSAGRYKQLTEPEILKARPLWMWRHKDSRVPRKHHLALDGKIFPADSPFWKVATPSCGFGCRCAVFSLSQKEVAREGLEVSEPPKETVSIKDKVTGEVKKIPALAGVPIADPGFTSPAGSTPDNQKKAILEQAMQRLHPELQKLVKDQVKKRG